MKKKSCSQCGHPNDWNALTCVQCGTLFDRKEEIPQVPKSERISDWLKWGLYFTAWGGVTVDMGFRYPTVVNKMLIFPVGFIGLLPNQVQQFAVIVGNMGAFFFGWAGYFLLTRAMWRAQRPAPFFKAYVIFAVLLIINLVGWGRFVGSWGGH